MKILGISSYYHDSAACLIVDGEIVAAAQEERFTRKKHDSGFPCFAVKYCLKEAGIDIKDIDYVSYYEKPLIKFERILDTYVSFAPKGFSSFVRSMPDWLKNKLFIKKTIEKELNAIDNTELKAKILFVEHHESHAASAFYCSPYKKSAIITMDGVGESTTTSIGIGDGNNINFLKEITFPHSLGLLYSAFTYYLGFKVNSGEYKVMGLAPYGKPKYVDLIKKHIIDIKNDGSYRMNMDYFGYCTGLVMTNKKFDLLFGASPRKPEASLTQREMDIAASLQAITDEIVLKTAYYAKKITGLENLCMAGGVALNCVANGKIINQKIFNNVWIQPASGDAGGAIGSALSIWYRYLNNIREVDGSDKMRGSYLGVSFSNNEILNYLNSKNIPFSYFDDDLLVDKVSDILIDGMVVGWFQGRMEFGPRALGNRSIIGDARKQKMQSVMNLKIKFRESFRPFAPSVLRERVSEYFDINCDSPYMLIVGNVLKNRRTKLSENQNKLEGIDLLNVPHSDIPAVTHVDYSARIQTVHKNTNKKYWNLIKRFEDKTGCATIINTSFNVRGEPIVCTPADAFTCFVRTGIDFLVLGNYIIDKKQVENFKDVSDWKKDFKLD